MICTFRASTKAFFNSLLNSAFIFEGLIVAATVLLAAIVVALYVRYYRTGRYISLRFRALIVAILGVVVLAACFGYRHLYRSGYPLAPREFYKQADRISPGMSKEEVLALVTVYTDCEWTNDRRVRFLMKPNSRDGLLRTTLHIGVEFGPGGRVVAVRTGDG